MPPLHRLNVQPFVDASEVDHPRRAQERSNGDAALAAEAVCEPFRSELVQGKIFQRAFRKFEQCGVTQKPVCRR